MDDKYTVTSLKNEVIGHYPSIRKIAMKMKVSESTIENRLKKKITKFSEVKGDKYKFNVRRNNESN